MIEFLHQNASVAIIAVFFSGYLAYYTLFVAKVSKNCEPTGSVLQKLSSANYNPVSRCSAVGLVIRKQDANVF